MPWPEAFGALGAERALAVALAAAQAAGEAAWPSAAKRRR